MPTDNEDSGFLSRWSRRKVLVRQGAPVEEVAPPVGPGPALSPAPTVTAGLVATPGQVAASTTALAEPSTADRANETTPQVETVQPPPPTLADVAALTRDSDFSRFVGKQVQPDVKNAALAKLFTDPHFNVMDRLDTYIDDYGKPDPLPPGMLRQMLQAHTLGLFDEEDEQKKAAMERAAPTTGAAEPPDSGEAPCAPSSSDNSTPTSTEASADENPDLQLQPDHALGCASLEPGAGQDAGGQHGRSGDGPHAAVPA
jgi:hypothetical protein